MVDVRCTNFDNNLWLYVQENARIRGTKRCEALEQIIKEHIQLVARFQMEWLEKKENV